MPRKTDFQKQLRLAVVREYRASFNSLEHTAEAFNVSPETMKGWLERIGQKQNPVPSDTWSQTHLERYSKSERFFEGERDMLQKSEGTIEGKHYRMQDFIIERGAKLPDMPEFRGKQKYYQIIISGKERGKTRHRATPVSMDIDTAQSIARKMMAEYGKRGFRGQVAYLRVLTSK